MAEDGYDGGYENVQEDFYAERGRIRDDDYKRSSKYYDEPVRKPGTRYKERSTPRASKSGRRKDYRDDDDDLDDDFYRGLSRRATAPATMKGGFNEKDGYYDDEFQDDYDYEAAIDKYNRKINPEDPSHAQLQNTKDVTSNGVIDRLDRLLKTGGTDTLLSTSQQALKLFSAFNPTVGHSTGKDPEGLFDPGSLAGTIGDIRTASRLKGLVGTYEWAKEHKRSKKEDDDPVARGIVWAQIAAGFAFSGYENLGFLASKGAIKLSKDDEKSKKRADNWLMQSCRYWLAHVVLEQGRLAREIQKNKKEIQRIKDEIADDNWDDEYYDQDKFFDRHDNFLYDEAEDDAYDRIDELKKKNKDFKKQIAIQAAWTPVAANYSVEKPFLSPKVGSVLGLGAAGTKLHGLWKATKDPEPEK